MELVTVVLIAIGLAMDAFSVCIVSGVKIRTLSARHYFRLSFHFGLFQFLMPLIGYYGGVMIENSVQSYDHWIAFALLLIIGLKMLWESLGQEEETETLKRGDPSRGMTLVILSLATSIDAAAVGFSFAALQVPIVFPAIIIGLVCILFSAIGLFIGDKIGMIIGQWAERIGGLLLILIGVKILTDHIS